MTRFKTFNEVVSAMAKRAGELASDSIDVLRISYPLTTETSGELRAECKRMGFSRADMVEAILTEEFCEEWDFDLENKDA